MAELPVLVRDEIPSDYMELCKAAIERLLTDGWPHAPLVLRALQRSMDDAANLSHRLGDIGEVLLAVIAEPHNQSTAAPSLARDVLRMVVGGA